MKRFTSWKLLALAVLLGWVAIQLAVVASLWSYGSRTEQLVFQQNRTKARLLVDQSLYIEHWKNLESNSDFLPLVQDLAANLRKQAYQARFIRPFDTDRDRQPQTPLEERLLKQFMRPRKEPERGQRPQPEFWERLVDGGKQYEYYQPIYAELSCTFCHNAMLPMGGGGSPALLAEGGLMAVGQVTFSNEPMLAALNRSRVLMVSTAVVTAVVTAVLAAVVILALYLTVRFRGQKR